MYRQHDNVFSIIDYRRWREEYRDNGKCYVIAARKKDLDDIETGRLISTFKDIFQNEVSTRSSLKCIPIVTQYKDWENFYDDEISLLILDKKREEGVDLAYLQSLLEKTGRKDEYLVIDEMDNDVKDGEYLLTFSYGCPWKKKNRKEAK